MSFKYLKKVRLEHADKEIVNRLSEIVRSTANTEAALEPVRWAFVTKRRYGSQIYSSERNYE